MAPPVKRRKTEQVDLITFNPDARHEYLTGFHKRKLQRKENARDAAVKREKEERVRERRQLREQRKEDLEAHVAQVNAELRKQNPDLSSDDEDEGEDHAEGEGVNGKHAVPDVPQEEEEFVDEDKYTTVTVEPMGDSGAVESNSDDGEVKAVMKTDSTSDNGKTTKRKSWSKDGKPPAKKKRSFRYESKAERQATRQKQKSKSHAAKVRRTGN